ncbi:MAG: PAS domain S-box protein [Candidatus Thorarchaeota archaeon]
MENLQLLLSIIEGSNDLIQSVEPSGRFEFVNSAWLRTLGYSDAEVPALELKDVIFPGGLKKLKKLIDEAHSGRHVSNVSVTFVTKDGEMVYTEGSLFPRREGSKIIAAVGFFRNVTDRKKTEEELNEERARTEFFVDLMVHDLTNIHQEILSTLEILRLSESLPRDLESIIDGSLREIGRASDIVSNVRKITRLYSMKPETRVHDLYVAIENSAKNVREAFPEKRLDLSTNISEGQYSLLADEFLEDVFYALFHNSMKFDKSNNVKVTVEVEPLRHTPFLKIQIKDHGPGIRDEDKETVFARLSHRREGLGGLGLGLTLVKKIIENYGGYIRVEDRIEGNPSKGCNFILLLRHSTEGTTEV